MNTADVEKVLVECPSCGSAAQTVDRHETPRGIFGRVICSRNVPGMPGRCYMKTTAGPIDVVVAQWNRRPPVDSVGVDGVVVSAIETAADEIESLGGDDDMLVALRRLVQRLRNPAALTAPADGCPACGANWDSEHNRCEGNCDKLLSEKEG